MNAYEKAVFYASQNPQPVAEILEKLENLTAVLVNPLEIGEAFTDTVEVANGTILSAVPKPANVVISDGVLTHEIALTFATTTTPSYDGDVAGTYVCAGTLGTLPATLKNTGSYKYNLSIVVAEA